MLRNESRRFTSRNRVLDRDLSHGNDRHDLAAQEDLHNIEIAAGEPDIGIAAAPKQTWYRECWINCRNICRSKKQFTVVPMPGHNAVQVSV